MLVGSRHYSTNAVRNNKIDKFPRRLLNAAALIYISDPSVGLKLELSLNTSTKIFTANHEGKESL